MFSHWHIEEMGQHETTTCINQNMSCTADTLFLSASSVSAHFTVFMSSEIHFQVLISRYPTELISSARTWPDHPILNPEAWAWVTVCRHRDGPKCLLLLSKQGKLKKSSLSKQEHFYILFTYLKCTLAVNCPHFSYNKHTFTSLCVAKKLAKQKDGKDIEKCKWMEEKKRKTKKKSFFCTLCLWQDKQTTHSEVTCSVIVYFCFFEYIFYEFCIYFVK